MDNFPQPNHNRQVWPENYNCNQPKPVEKSQLKKCTKKNKYLNWLL